MYRRVVNFEEPVNGGELRRTPDKYRKSSGYTAPPRGNHRITEFKTPRGSMSQYPVSCVCGVAVAKTLFHLLISKVL